jgi:putative phosphoribosyl transferase
MAQQFENRRTAGAFLATFLTHYMHQPNVVVLALPRGGVPVAYEVAKRLHAPLDVFVVRKLGVPGHEEMAMGAIASGDVRVLNHDLVDYLNISEETIERVATQEYQELERREKLYRKQGTRPELEGKTVILVDDGLATGASMWAAVVALRQHHPARIIVAVPVSSKESCAAFEKEVDEIICASTPQSFRAVGSWYRDFSQTTDEEVRELLERAAQENPVS